MRKKYDEIVEAGRIVEGSYFTSRGSASGAFYLQTNDSRQLLVIASDGPDWEHVSASNPAFTPSWEDMCWLKSLFFEPHEWVVQYHPSENSHINLHPHCLHLWRPLGCVLPVPPMECV